MDPYGTLLEASLTGQKYSLLNPRDLPQNAACCAALDGDLADLGLPQTFGKVKPQNATNHPPTATLNGRSAAVSVPVEWQQLIDPDTESVYYYNPATKESRWDAAAPFDSTIETTASPPQQPADNLPAVQPVATQRAMTTGMFEQGLPSSPNPLPGQHVVFDRSSSDGSHSEPQLGTDTLPAQSQPLSGSDTLTDIFPGAPLGKAASPGAALADLATSRGVPIWPVADPVLASYWKHRHHLFSRFDQGILIDREGWFSVTPEFIAAHQATALLETPGFVVDLGCCVGGNTVQLAAAGNHVLAVDVCAPRLALAAHNAEVYGVRDRVTFVAADMREMESWRAQVCVCVCRW